MASREQERELLIRPGLAGDLSALNDLYNHYVVNSHATFDLEPITPEARQEWFSHYSDPGPHRLLVAVEGDQLLGYTTSSRFRPKRAYATSVETSIYLSPGATGRGVGRALYEALFAALEDEDLHRAYGGIALPSPASVALHERLGFTRVAHFTEQGRKFGRYWDVAWYEKQL